MKKYVALLLTVFVPTVFGAGTCQDTLIPAYFYPDWWNNPETYWDRIDDDVPLPSGRERIAVINPASGVGTVPNPDYVQQVAAAKDADLLVLGYISTQWGARPIEEVKAEAAKYASWYSITDGVFLDEASTAPAPADLAYYQELVLYITALMNGSDIVLNHGTYPDETYLNLETTSANNAVISVTFEGPFSTFMNVVAPEWVDDYPDWYFSHLIYDTPTQFAAAALAKSAEMNTGWTYVTDDVLPNPWNTLPPYWELLTIATTADCY